MIKEILPDLCWEGIDGEYYSRETGSVNEYDFNVSFNVSRPLLFWCNLRCL